MGVFKPEDDKFESMTDSDNVHSIGVGYHKRADALVLYDKDDGSIYMAGRGGAPNIWTEPDQIVFYGQEFSGDYSVVVKADSISPSGRDGLNSWSKAGITFRSTLDPSSEHYTLMLTGNQGMGPHWRPTRGAQTTWGGWNYFINKGATEAWLKLVKRGDILMSYIGTEGEEGTVVWESLHTIEMKLEETYFIGLVICAQSSRYEIEARFANFEVTKLADADSMTNLALGKPVMQSSTGWGGVAERAVDGNTNGNYHDNTVTHTAYGDSEPWFVVDLGGLSLIEIIYVYSRTDCCYWRHKGALVELIHEGKVVGTRNLHGNKLDVIDFSDGSYLASKIRVSSNTYVSIAEFEVYGEVSKTDGEAGSSSPTNLALGKPVEQSQRDGAELLSERWMEIQMASGRVARSRILTTMGHTEKQFLGSSWIFFSPHRLITSKSMAAPTAAAGVLETRSWNLYSELMLYALEISLAAILIYFISQMILALPLRYV